MVLLNWISELPKVKSLVYFDHGLVKLDIGIAKGKKLYDKRQTIAKNDQRREAEKEFKIRNLTL